jgi:hypothetical protein
VEQRNGERIRISEILRPHRHTGDRMVGRQRADRGAKVAQLRLRGADAEQAAILLHHVDADTPICRINHQVHRAVGRKDITQRPQADIRVG